MVQFSNSSANNAPSRWQYRLDRFVKTHQSSLAALAWGLRQEWDNQGDMLGIDLKTTPHFICCSYEAIAQLNENVDCKIQEILGIIEHYDPQEEVVIITIANSQIQLIYFQPNPTPPECFAQHQLNLDQLIQSLETEMQSIGIED